MDGYYVSKASTSINTFNFEQAKQKTAKSIHFTKKPRKSLAVLQRYAIRARRSSATPNKNCRTKLPAFNTQNCQYLENYRTDFDNTCTIP